MNTETKLSRFAKYAWFVVAYNLVVILWGVFLRASKSGDGCGQHWLTCNGEIVPAAPQFKTIIEFSHRVTSSLAGIFIVILLVWAFAKWRSQRTEQGGNLLKAAVGSFVFVVFEGLIGAGLVLTGNTAETLTAARPFWTAAHLVNTLVLLAFLTLTAWLASGRRTLAIRNCDSKTLILLSLGVVGMFLIGISGSIAALSGMLFPSASLAESAAKDFSETSHILLQLRVSHPILSILFGIFLLFLARRFKWEVDTNFFNVRWANALSALVLVQFLWGAATLLTLAPIVMQLGHLLLADLVWIVFILLSANVLTEDTQKERKSFAVETQSAVM